MNIYRHPKNNSIIATNATHCVYVPPPPNASIKDQLSDANAMLIQLNTRCFLFDPDLTDAMLDAGRVPHLPGDNTEPDAPLAGPDFEHGEPEPHQT